ncbi:MAG: hypothetical protein IPK80_16160 [Nannocystis sp.]|nr:hypothetical protein [Nannocystis sp.]
MTPSMPAGRSARQSGVGSPEATVPAVCGGAREEIAAAPLGGDLLTCREITTAAT